MDVMAFWKKTGAAAVEENCGKNAATEAARFLKIHSGLGEAVCKIEG